MVIRFRPGPGYHQVCPICLWEDELAQLRFPTMPGISNSVSLVDTQNNYQRTGVAERENEGQGRAAFADEALEEGWRPIDPLIDNLEQPTSGEDYSTSYPLVQYHRALLLAADLLAASGGLTSPSSKIVILA